MTPHGKKGKFARNDVVITLKKIILLVPLVSLDMDFFQFDNMLTSLPMQVNSDDTDF